MIESDTCVIGAGPAGYSAAITASQLGAKVVLLEREQLGGTCLNYGCIPTSVVSESVDMIRLSKKGESFGIKLGIPEIDPNTIMLRAENVKRTLCEGLREVLKSNNIIYKVGKAEVLDRHQIRVEGKSGSFENIVFDSLIVATGSRPQRRFESSRVIADRDTFAQRIPEGDVVVLGGNPVGVKLAYLLNYLGCKVTVLEKSQRILPAFDREISSRLKRSLTTQGITFMEARNVREAKERGDSVQLFPDSGEAINASLVIDTEREAETHSVSALGLTLTEKGFIHVNEHLETSCSGIYAAGDVTGCTSASEAYMHGRIAGQNVNGLRSSSSTIVPRCVHVRPEAASLGLTEDEARSRGTEIAVGRFPLGASGKAQAMGEPEGFAKLVSDVSTREILGVHLLGPGAVDLISIACVAMELEATPQTLAAVVYPHPVLSESLREAALHSIGLPLHIPMNRRRIG